SPGASHECPFRAMDEFDVYMDQVSRGKALKQVKNYALEKQADKQFIFITPQNLSSI
ncbi:unnamed protein product, partial [Chrysoparadoxa australica]